MNIEKSV